MADRFETATAITQLDSHTYSADFPDEWCIGSVPNGGLITSCFMRIASLHFATTLAKQSQPHTIALHLEFLRRTQEGPAKFVVKEKKLGRQVSVVHITLFQDGREEVVGYISQSNLATEQGVSFTTDWALHPPALPANTSKFEADTCENWCERKNVAAFDLRKSSARLRWFFPRGGQRTESVSDQWVCLSSGEMFTQESLGFVCDNFPLVVESYIKPRLYDADGLLDPTAVRYWYPTLLLNLDVKKALPKEGVKYLFVRTQSKQIKNGRLDVEVTVLDETGDLVALSHHVVLVVGLERNLATRSNI